jgi:biotin operon repressor
MSDQSVSDVRAYSKSTGYAKFLLIIIASHTHYKAEYAYPSLETLAREVTLSKPAIIKLIKSLEALGELEVLRGHGRGQSNRYRITIAHEAHSDRSDEEDPDQPKGKPYLYLLPTLADMEQVNDPKEKVKSDPLKGQPSVDSKEVLRTSKERTEREPFAIEKVNGPDLDALAPVKAEASSPFWCPDCGYATPSCVHRTVYHVEAPPGHRASPTVQLHWARRTP